GVEIGIMKNKTDYEWECEHCGKTYDTKKECDKHEKKCKENTGFNRNIKFFITIVIISFIFIIAMIFISYFSENQANDNERNQVYESYETLLEDYTELKYEYDKLDMNCSGLLEDWNRWIGSGSRVNTTYGWFNVPENITHSSLACTGSMEPTLDCNDKVLYAPVYSPGDIKVGDVISFKRPLGSSLSGNSTDILHRVVKIMYLEDGVYYRTKGDNNQGNDPTLIPFEDVTGKLIIVIYGWE
ncbi:signal peptidase I, partial [Candidatus Aenigmatarchaeota archaeon]